MHAVTVLVATLARVCAGEGGLQVETQDCAAIWQTAEAGGERRGVSPRTWLRDHSTAHLSRQARRVKRNGRRSWIPVLEPSRVAPPSWPAKLPWTEWRNRVSRLWDHARRIITGDIDRPCPQPPHTWGSDRDWALFQRQHPQAYKLECGRTLNHFVRVPALR